MTCKCDSVELLRDNEAEEYIEYHLERIGDLEASKGIEFACSQCKAKWVLDYSYIQIQGSGGSKLKKIG
jgi:hypothetical protein